MEFELTRRTVPEGVIPAGLTAELPIECDILLPDYCPDVMKILRVSARPAVAQAEASGGHVSAEGAVHVAVYYLSPEGELCRNEQRIPFTKGFDFPIEPERAASSVTAAVENVSCRAVSPRRMDVRGAFALTAKLMGVSGTEAVTGASGAGVELLKNQCSFTDVLGEYCKSFTVRETGEIGYGKPEAASVARCSGMARVTECRLMRDKIVTKGELSVTLLWTSHEDGSLQRSGFSFPISCITDAPGASDDCLCDARYRLQSLTATVAEDGRGFEIEAAVAAFARLQRETTETLAEDAYSTKYGSSAPAGSISALRMASPVAETVAVDELPELPEDVTAVEDCWAEAGPAGLTEDGALRSTVRLCIFARDGEGALEYFEKPFEVSTPGLLTPGEGPLFVDADVSADEADCTLEGGGRARVRFKVCFDGCICSLEEMPALADISVDSQRPADTGRAAMTLYYADPGERVWDIARRYGSTGEAMTRENGLEGPVISERRMLLVPTEG